MKWAVDRIEDNIAILENIDTLEKKEVAISLLPSSIYEGSILRYQNNTYIADISEEEIRRKLIEEKFRKLRNNN